MDHLLALTWSDTAEFSQHFHPPIILDENSTYVLGLFSLNTYNSIPNILDEVNNAIYFVEEEMINLNSTVENDKNNSGLLDINSIKLKKVTIPEGAYEMEALATYIATEAEKLGVKSFTMKPNINTLKVELFAENHHIFLPTESIAKLIGFEPNNQKCLGANKTHFSSRPIEITTVNEINVECNIVDGSHRNGVRCHTLYSFPPDVPPGYKISERPSPMIYLPIKAREISNITLRLSDQRGRPIHFRGEEISVQLNLHKF